MFLRRLLSIDKYESFCFVVPGGLNAVSGSGYGDRKKWQNNIPESPQQGCFEIFKVYAVFGYQRRIFNSAVSLRLVKLFDRCARSIRSKRSSCSNCSNVRIEKDHPGVIRFERIRPGRMIQLLEQVEQFYHGMMIKSSGFREMFCLISFPEITRS